MMIIDYLANELYISKSDIRDFIKTAPYRYKIYTIPKANKIDTRTIAQPSRELKYIQRLVSRNYLSDLPVHESATAYRTGMGIKVNAKVHSQNKYFMKMDFKNFFPSIKPNDLHAHIDKYSELTWKSDDKYIIGKIFFYIKDRAYTPVLSIGAPTSPLISNTIMYDFDQIITSTCQAQNITYSRYADDLTFSTNIKDILFGLPNTVVQILSEMGSPNLQINEEKTVFLSHRSNVHITGLVISSTHKVSIGRKKKRYIKSLIFKFLNHDLHNKDMSYLIGYLSFCNSVEPSFLTTLEKKYGKENMDKIRGLKHYSD